MVKTLTLKNGLRLVLEYIPHVQSAAMGIWVNVGCVNEKAEIAGISHFIEHMMFKGTENRSAKEIASDIDKLGGQINAFTGKEATCYYIKTISSNLLQGAEVLVDMLENSQFLDEEMDKERKVIEEEIKMTQDTPDDLCLDEMIELVFTGKPYGHSIIGTPKTLAGIDSKVMKDYFKTQYSVDRMLISVSGNFDEDELVKYFEDKFSGFRKENPAVDLSGKPYSKGAKVVKKDIEQSHIALGNIGVNMASDEYYDLVILSKIFGGSMSSRLFQNIREQKGLAYTIISMYGTYKEDGYFAIYAGVSHDKIDEALKGIKEELDSLLKDGITAEELAMAKEQIKSSFIFGQESVASRMFNNGKSILLLGQVESQEEFIEKVDKVSLESVKKLIDRLCHYEDFTRVVVTGKDTDYEN